MGAFRDRKPGMFILLVQQYYTYNIDTLDVNTYT